jgi:hypothetical protein
MTTTDTKTKYKYITKSRLDGTLKKFNLRVEYQKGSKEFRFVDTQTGVQVGDTLVLDRLYSLNISEWRAAARNAREGVAGPGSETAAQVREFVESLESAEA